MEKDEYWNPNGKPVVGEGKFAKRHSFFPPFDPLAIPYWSMGAGAKVEMTGSMDSIGNHSFVRITPAKQARTGYVWNERVSTMSDWAGKKKRDRETDTDKDRDRDRDRDREYTVI